MTDRARRLRRCLRLAAFSCFPIATLVSCSDSTSPTTSCVKSIAFLKAQDAIAVQTRAQFAVLATEGCSDIVTWKSSNPSLLSVDQTGLVSALGGAGSATISASAGDKTVSRVVKSIVGGTYATVVSPDTVRLHMGQTVQLNPVSTTSFGDRTIDQSFTYSLPPTFGRAPAVSVNASGLVTVLSNDSGNDGGFVYVAVRSSLGAQSGTFVFITP